MLNALVEREFWQAYYAGLMKQAKDLQEQRAAVLQQAAVIKRHCLGGEAVVTSAAEVAVDSQVVKLGE